MTRAIGLGAAAAAAVALTLIALAWLWSGASDASNGGLASAARLAPEASVEPVVESSTAGERSDLGSAQPDVAPAELAGASGSAFVARVIDATGAAVPEAVVELRRPAECWATPAFQRLVTSADGTCDLGADRTAFVVAHKEGVGLSEEVDLTAVDPAIRRVLTLRLQPHCLVTVLTPDTLPSDREWLNTVCESMEYGVAHGERCTVDSPLGAHWHARPRAPFEGLVLASRGACPMAGAPLTAAAGELVVVEAPQLEGFGFVSRSQQLADESVQALRLRIRHEAGERFERIQSHPIELVQGLEAHGRYVVAADAEGCLMSPRGEAVVSEDCPVGHVDLRLEPAAPILGRVVRPSGRAVEWAIVSAQALLDRPTDDVWEDLTSRGLRTDADGGFAFPCVDPSLRYTIRIRSFEEGSEQVFVFGDVAPGAEPRDYVLTEDALCSRTTIAGRVIDANTGFPVPHFTTRFSEARYNSVILDGRLLGMPRDFESTSGEFEFTDLDASKRYVMQVQTDEPATAPENSVIVGPISPGHGGCGLEIVIGKPGALQVTVVDESGGTVSGARAYLRNAGAGEIVNRVFPVREGRTNKDGELSWSGLRPGWYSALAMTESREWGGSLVSVTAGERSAVRVVARSRRTTGSLRIGCPPEAVTSDASRLELRRCGDHPAWRLAPSSQWVPWRPDANGFTVASELLTDEYEVKLWQGDAVEASGFAVVFPDEPATLRLEMMRR